MRATQISFSSLISTDGQMDVYHIPKYQREYTWGKWQWTQLLQDIEENTPGYFMGSIICIPDTRAGLPTVYELIDGQQRITTLSILIAAWIDKYAPFREDADDEVITNLASMKKRLLFTKNVDGNVDQRVESHNGDYLYIRIRPSIQGNNFDDYKYLLAETGLIDDVIKPQYWGLRRIAQAYTFFYKSLPDTREELEQIKNKLDSLAFIHINADSHSDAFVLFESLNNRGIPLSIMDIIKNKLLASLDHVGEQQLDEAFKKWLKLLGHLEEPSIQERFLRHYYNAFRDEKKLRIEGESRATRSNLVRIYDQIIDKNDTQQFFNNLVEVSSIYSSLVYPDKREEGDILKIYLDELNYLGAAPVFAFLLYLDVLNIFTIKEKVKIYELMCKYFFRRSLTDKPATRSLDYIIMQLIDDIDEYSYDSIEEVLTKNRDYPIATLDEVEKSLSGDVYRTNKDATRYALYKLEHSFNNRGFSPNLWDRNSKNKLIWTIEHILPQNENMRDEWVDAIADGNRNSAIDLKEKFAHKIGNLTLTTSNSKLSDKPFNEKQVCKEINAYGTTVNVGLKNGLALNSNLAYENNGLEESVESADNWDINRIQARSGVMVAKIKELMKFSWE